MRMCLRSALGWLGRAAFVFVMAATVLGCATTSGPSMSSLVSGAGAPPAGQSRIVVIRPEKVFFGWGDRALPVVLDGQPIGDLLTGTYVSADRPAGQHQLSIDLWDMPGVSRHDFTTAPGRTYYFAARVKERVNGMAAATVFAGLAGYAVAAAASNDGAGQVDIIPMSEAEAKRAIATAPR
jgi:Protein of unknown function (DUF2846)